MKNDTNLTARVIVPDGIFVALMIGTRVCAKLK